MKASIFRFFRLPALIVAISGLVISVPAAAPPRDGPPSLEREAQSAYQQGRYDRVTTLLENLPPGHDPSRHLLQIGMFSYLRLGKPEAAWKLYLRLVPAGRTDEPRWLREVAHAFITSQARNPEEHVRMTAYSALADIAGRDAVPLLEDGLLDSSIVVRARAAEGLGRVAVLAKRSGLSPSVAGLKRALSDPAPAVQIAALNAFGDLGDRKDRSTLEIITRLAQTDEGAVHVFALAALVKLGRTDAFADIVSAASAPEPDARMAAIGVLGRLKHASSLPVLSQSIYDPDPSVRAFTAGALGELGVPGAAAPLTQALEDENPRVRGIAAASLGRLGLASVRPLLKGVARDPVALVRAGAIEGLLRLGDKDALLLAADLARHPDPSVRSAMAQAAGLSGNRLILPVLEPLLTDSQPQPRLMAAVALGKIGNMAALPMLKQILSDTDPAVRTAAAGSLVQILSRRKA